MPSAYHEIIIEQGETLSLYLTFKDASGTVKDLSGSTADMMCRRSATADAILFHAQGSINADDSVTFSGLTGGGTTGEYTPGNTFAGTAGLGGITLNSSSAGATGTTGGILINMDAATTKNIPRGRFFYDLEINASGTVTKVISGRFEVLGEISR